MARAGFGIIGTSILTMIASPLAAQYLAESKLVWPSPPDPARVEYVGWLHSEKDVGKKSSLLDQVKKTLVGDDSKITTLLRPHDVYASPSGNVYVTDRAEGGRLLVFDTEEKEARIIAPVGEGQMGKPMGLAGNARGWIYVADPVNRRIVCLDANGEFIRAYGGSSVLLNPVDVAATPSGDRVCVVDSYLHQLVIFDEEGAVLRRVGRDDGDLASKLTRRELHQSDASLRDSLAAEPSDLVENRGSEPGEFRFPGFVAMSEMGEVYVSDAMNFRMQAFDRDGEFIREIGQLGRTPGSLARPKGAGVDSRGHLYIADAAFNNVQIFDPDGRLLLAFGSAGNKDGQFWQPAGMCVTDDRIYVVDRFNNRVQIFAYLDVEQTASETDILTRQQ